MSPAPLPDPSSIAEPAPPRHRRRWLWGGVGVAGVVVVAVLAFGVFGVQTLVVDDTVDEGALELDSGAVIPDDGPVADGSGPSTSAPPAPEVELEADTEAPAPPPPTTEPAVTLVATGGFAGEDHPGEGTANIYTDGTQGVVRFEDDFATDNGPDLFAVVYVGDERIELGRLKGNRGSQNYVLPEGVDPAAVDAVSVWCKRFDSTFTTATVG